MVEVCPATCSSFCGLSVPIPTCEKEAIGSNNWAISPNKSYSGNAILANDPHLGLNLPSIWFAIQLSSPNQNTYGVSLPGSPGVVIGFNEKIAWGMTNATRDVIDWYKIKFEDSTQSRYQYDNDFKMATKRIEKIAIRAGVKIFIFLTFNNG